MPATIATTCASFAVIGFGEDQKSVFKVIIFAFRQNLSACLVLFARFHHAVQKQTFRKSIVRYGLMLLLLRVQILFFAMKLLVKALLLSFSTLFCATLLSAQSDSLVIEGFIEGLPAGKMKLIGTFGDQNFMSDSTVVDAQGHFVVRRKNTIPGGYYYFLMSNGINFSILLDDNEQKVTLRGSTKDLVNTITAEGSLNSELLYEGFRIQARQETEMNQISEIMKSNPPGTPAYAEARARQDALLAERKAQVAEAVRKYPNALYSKFKIAGQNPEFIEFKKKNGDTDTVRQIVSYRDRFWDGVDFNDNRLLRTPVIHNKLKRYIKELTPQHPDSLIKVSDALIRRVMDKPEYFKFFSNWIALQYENTKTTVMDGEAVYVHIIQNFFTDQLAFWDKPENLAKLRKHAWEMEASLMGRKGQDVTAKNQYGYEKSLYETTAPVVIVFMFSPDCEHCIEHADEIEAFYQKWKDKGVDFFGIAINTTEGEWKQFLEEHKFSFTNVYDPTYKSVYAKYYVDITPEIYVLNPDRIIVAKNLQPSQLEAVVTRELRKAKKL